MNRPNPRRLQLLLSALLAVGTMQSAFAQKTGQPASDVLMQFDIWGNPTFRGGVTNNGTNAHSVW